MKVCSNCQTEKSLSEFYPHRSKKGHQSICKTCDSSRSSNYYLLNKEQIKKKSVAWRDANPEKVKLYRQRSTEKPRNYKKDSERRTRVRKRKRFISNMNKEFYFAYRNLHGYRLLSVLRFFYQRQQIQGITKRCSWCKVVKVTTEFHQKRASLDGYSSHCKVCRSDHNKTPEGRSLLRIRNRRRRARKKEAYVEDIPQVYIDLLLVRQNNLCRYCLVDFDLTPYEVEHIIPLSRDGKDEKRNIQLACKSCNDSKNDKTHEEYSEYLKRTKVWMRE